MKLEDILSEIRLELTGNVTHLEIKDETLAQIVKKSLREINRYIDSTKLITVPFTPCIDLKGWPHTAVINVFRTEGYTGDITSGGVMYADPMQAQMWMAFSNGSTMYNLQDYILNYMSYNTLLQMRNTTSTDLAFREDKSENKLYVNTGYDAPVNITIEYIPEYTDVEQIDDPYWLDVLIRLSTATTKVILGNIRNKYTQTNSNWTVNGERLLEEGNEELKELRERLRLNDQLSWGVD